MQSGVHWGGSLGNADPSPPFLWGCPLVAPAPGIQVAIVAPAWRGLWCGVLSPGPGALRCGSPPSPSSQLSSHRATDPLSALGSPLGTWG